MLHPATEAELATTLREAAAPLAIQGNGTKAAMLRPVQAADTLSTARLAGITLYAPKELVMSARAGTRLGEIEAALAAENQQMIGEPPWLFGENQTLGGMFASNLSGPRRITGGALRDHILGLRCVNGAGEVQKFGGRVLKNVTGLDIPKFLTGSFGTLAVITEITFKVLPKPEAVGTIKLTCKDAFAAVTAMSAALGSPFSVSGAACRRDPEIDREDCIVYLRIEDFAAAVKYRCEKLAAQLGGGEILDTAPSEQLWADIRDVKFLREDAVLWRLSVPPSAAPAVLHAADGLGLEALLDWGGGLIWLSGPADVPTHEAICAEARKAGGVWWVMRGPPGFRAAVEVVPPEPPALARLSRALKASFDPRGILNPGRLRAA